MNFYDRLFKEKLRDRALTDKLCAFTKNKRIQHQQLINNVLIALIEEKRYGESRYVKKYQEIISNDSRKAYEAQEGFDTDFTRYDCIFMLVAMLQVLFHYVIPRFQHRNVLI